MNRSNGLASLRWHPLFEYLQLIEPLIFFLLLPDVLADLGFIPPYRGHVISLTPKNSAPQNSSLDP
jgi:hypothetical protein